MIAEKKKIRQGIQQKIKQLAPHQRKLGEEAISRNLLSFLTRNSLFHSKCKVAVYRPLRDEVAWHSCFEGKECVFLFPQVLTPGKMRFLSGDLWSVCQGREEHSLSQDLAGEELTPDMVLVPGLAFSPQGGRLGRGGGYYDRFLASFEGLKVAVAFELQLLQEFPLEDHDQEVDVVITERTIYYRQS